MTCAQDESSVASHLGERAPKPADADDSAVTQPQPVESAPEPSCTTDTNASAHQVDTRHNGLDIDPFPSNLPNEKAGSTGAEEPLGDQQAGVSQQGQEVEARGLEEGTSSRGSSALEAFLEGAADPYAARRCCQHIFPCPSS